MAVFYVLWIFTILVVSPTQLKLIAEKIEINVENPRSFGRSEFYFSNTREGDRLLGKKKNQLRGNDDWEECVIDLADSAGGYYYDRDYRNFPKDLGETKGLSHSELADLCKKVHRH
ncbi:hypothetical protein DLM76_20855 [Leptospira yasudae]|uniref:Uncharacterized protein n=1 Tax=Leptospira yasudae TaxID=2202201 RepID=A0ABX9LXJ4_9LEPT|nr:hypothetical protein [Leptospira yasudae]RHX77533.1 hypothetical protein DLM77_20680 [Leptospira yasudae]RHX90171.1 hypothetical protein DLM76_20855 [Leptospira yasudae]TGK31356.1 hypothetical protein EHQ05_00595 [Leptospira yasudae]TGM06380.1 hypothetical protein EHQ86_09030 [Leptospira yasudae]